MRQSPRWARVLLRWLAPPGDADDLLGDLEEAYRIHTRRHGPIEAHVRTGLETLDMAAALVRTRIDMFGSYRGSTAMQDYKLGFRMLIKYPGLTLAGGLAIALAIGIGAGWYDVMSDVLRPRLPLPGGDRFVEVQMRNVATSQGEWRVLHDFAIWRQEARSIEELGAYRTIERNLVLGDAQSAPVTVAAITASAFRLVQVPPLHGRPLLDADERPGAPPVVVLGYDVWRQWFGGRADAIGDTAQLGRTVATVVGIMPEGFAFPVNHQLWTPLQLLGSGYAPLEGSAVQVFGRLAPGATRAQANVELTALAERIAAASPPTHQHLRPRVLAYGAEYPDDESWIAVSVTHLPVILVLIVACANVGTLVYARTATRDAEIATRYALGASRGRIIGQLFIEALVLASVAAIVGLWAAHWTLKWGFDVYMAGEGYVPPFWIDPGLKLRTVLYAAVLTTTGAAMLGILPAIKATGSNVQAQLRNLGSGASTLRFGWGWTTVMLFEVALTVICIPVAWSFAEEALRDRRIRAQFPADQYLAALVAMDREAAAVPGAGEPAFRARLEQTYRELERRVAQEPGVVAVTFGNRLPGMSPVWRRAEIEASDGSAPIRVRNLWTSAVGSGYFEAFDKAIVAGRAFHDGDRTASATTVLVNQAFARQYSRYTNGASPLGRRVRYATDDPAKPGPWLEIVGIVEDMGMTPTNGGEAAYVYRAVSPATASPLVMGVRMAGDPASLVPRLRTLAASLDPDLKLEEVRTLDEIAWREDAPNMMITGASAAVVGLGLFMSAAGIFSLMSVSVARRTREIGLRTALGASPARLLAAIFRRALVLVGSGVAAGNFVILAVTVWTGASEMAEALPITSVVMLTVGLLACVEPARRALRIQPADALKEA
ncbi:MAG TPA: ABC transporter permease [Vicinamibacterales bacterium]|nr:ABC transporter permease [Vicinamibacterales bacterium]